MNQENLPQHIAIIPDGNRRWAKKKRLKPWRGHLKGAETGNELLQVALNKGIKCMSMWGGSWENLTERTNLEVKFLIKIYDKYIKLLSKRKELHDHKIKVNIIGRWREILPKNVIKTFENIIELTKDYNERYLNFFVAYNGTDEMIDAVRNILNSAKNKKIEVTANLIENNLWTAGLPAVDLLIRTGSDKDPHNSKGFMMWNCAESQLHFAKELFPDFKKKEFLKVINNFQRRERRYGK
ncbi:polyprenyl diphosphate synthase [Patescibacteria group bacterium]